MGTDAYRSGDQTTLNYGGPVSAISIGRGQAWERLGLWKGSPRVPVEVGLTPRAFMVNGLPGCTLLCHHRPPGKDLSWFVPL